MAEVPATIPAPQVHQVIKWAVSGATEHEIREAIATTYPGDDPAAMLAAAMSQIARNAQADPLMVLAWSFEASREMYQRMVESNDFAGALKALKAMNEYAAKMDGARIDDVSDEPEITTSEEAKPANRPRRKKP